MNLPRRLVFTANSLGMTVYLSTAFISMGVPPFAVTTQYMNISETWIGENSPHTHSEGTINLQTSDNMLAVGTASSQTDKSTVALLTILSY